MIFPSTTMPPPTPVPRITPNTTRAPCHAPSIASDSAKQLASFASRTSRARRVSRSCCSGLPLSQVEFAFFTRRVPDAGLVKSVTGRRRVSGREVSVSIAADVEVASVQAVVQVHAICSRVR